MDVIWVSTAYLMGWLGARVGLPPLVGYLIAGFGLFALGIRADTTLNQLAEVGVWLLLFTVGLKLRLQNLWQREVIGVGGLHLIVSSALMLTIFGSLLGLTNGLFIAVGLAFSSTVLAVKLLEDRQELSSYHGRIAVGILVLQDLVAIGLLFFTGSKQPSLWALAFLALPLLRPLALWLLSRSGHDELLLMFGLSFALAGGYLAKQVGLSAELGALLFGAVLAGHERTPELSKVLWGLKEAYLVAFFLTIGLGGLPPLELLPWGALMLLVLPLQGLLFFMLFTQFGLRSRTAFVTTLALSSYGEFALIVVTPLINAGQLDAGWAGLLGVVIAVSLSLTAPLNTMVHRLYDRLEPWLIRYERQSQHPDSEPTNLGETTWLVVGMGRTGGAAYKQLATNGTKVLGLDNDPVKLEQHTAKGRKVLYGDAEDPELWDRLEISRLEGVIVTTPDFEARTRSLEGLKRRGFSGTMATVSHHLDEEAVLEKAGANLIFRPFSEAGELLAQRALAKTK